MRVKGVRTLVVGMKKSGVAAVELLRREGAVGRATAFRPLDQIPEAQGLDLPFPIQSDAFLKTCALIVLPPDVPADLPPLEAARKRGVTVIGEVELAAPFLK